ADPPAERTEAVARLLDGYCQGVYAAAAVLYPAIVRLPADDRPAADGRLDRDAAVAWLDAERANLVAAAVRAAHDGPRSAAWRIADAMRGYFFFRRYTADWLTAARAGLRAAEAEHDRRAEAAMRTSIGLVHQSTGQLDQAAQ